MCESGNQIDLETISGQERETESIDLFWIQSKDAISYNVFDLNNILTSSDRDFADLVYSSRVLPLFIYDLSHTGRGFDSFPAIFTMEVPKAELSNAAAFEDGSEGVLKLKPSEFYGPIAEKIQEYAQTLDPNSQEWEKEFLGKYYNYLQALAKEADKQGILLDVSMVCKNLGLSEVYQIKKIDIIRVTETERNTPAEAKLSPDPTQRQAKGEIEKHEKPSGLVSRLQSVISRIRKSKGKN